MLSKALIVCLLAFLCLYVATAERLNTRIAGSNTSDVGQFPYIAYLSYDYVDASSNTITQEFTGIIYSDVSVITVASNFDNFPGTGATLTVKVGAFDINDAAATYSYAATLGTYDIEATTAPTAPSDLIVVPLQYTAGANTNNIAIVRLDGTDSFDLTDIEVAIANFPTSAPLLSNNLYAVAYGNQGQGSTETFPDLKYTRLYVKKATLCNTALVAAGLPALDRTQQFCVQSVPIAQTNNFFEGVCSLDIGGAIVRTLDASDPDTYYEVVGLLIYADDATTCDPTARVPAVIIYLSIFQDNFFTPILGSLTDAQNGQDATQNPDSARGNFICGNGVVEGLETCDTGAVAADNSCCSANTCNLKPAGKLCNGSKKGDASDFCITKQICDSEGTCATRNKNTNQTCDDAGSVCADGVCGSA